MQTIEVSHGDQRSYNIKALRFFSMYLTQKFMKDYREWEEAYKNEMNEKSNMLEKTETNNSIKFGQVTSKGGGNVKTIGEWMLEFAKEDHEFFEKKERLMRCYEAYTSPMHEKEKETSSHDMPWDMRKVDPSDMTICIQNLQVTLPPNHSRGNHYIDVPLNFDNIEGNGMIIGVEVESAVIPSDAFVSAQHLITRKIKTSDNKEEECTIVGVQKTEKVTMIGNEGHASEIEIPCLKLFSPFTNTHDWCQNLHQWASRHTQCLLLMDDESFSEVALKPENSIPKIEEKVVENKKRFFAHVNVDSALYKLMSDPGYFRALLQHEFDWSFIRYPFPSNGKMEDNVIKVPLVYVLLVLEKITQMSLESRKVMPHDKHKLRLFRPDGLRLSSPTDKETMLTIRLNFLAYNKQGYENLLKHTKAWTQPTQAEPHRR